MRSDKIKKGPKWIRHLEIQKIFVFIIFFVFFIPILVRASNLNEELANFLIRRTPTPAEDASTDNLSIEIKPERQDKPNLFVLPRITVWAFEDYLFSKRKFEELINFCEAAKKASPDLFTLYLMAESFEILGKIDESIEAYKKATEVLPDAPMLFFRLWGIYMYDKNKPIEAQENLDKFNSILQSSPDKEVSSAKSTLREDLMNMGNYFLNETRQFDRATKYFKMLLKMDPNFERAKLNLILCQFNKSVELRDREGFEKSLEEIRGMTGQSKDTEFTSFINQLLEKSKEIRKEAFGE